MAPRFEAAGVPVTVMGRRRLQHLATVPLLARWLARRRIDVVLLTPHHAATFLGAPAARLARVGGTALGLHQIGGKSIGIPSLPPGGVEMLSMIDMLILLSEAQLEYLRAEERVGSRPWRRTRHAIIPNGVRVGPRADACGRRRGAGRPRPGRRRHGGRLRRGPAAREGPRPAPAGDRAARRQGAAPAPRARRQRRPGAAPARPRGRARHRRPGAVRGLPRRRRAPAAGLRREVPDVDPGDLSRLGARGHGGGRARRDDRPRAACPSSCATASRASSSRSATRTRSSIASGGSSPTTASGGGWPATPMRASRGEFPAERTLRRYEAVFRHLAGRAPAG